MNWLLISRSVTGRASGLTAARSTVDQSPSFARRVRIGSPRNFSDSDYSLFLAAVIEKDFIARSHFAKIISRSKIAHAGPASFAVAQQSPTTNTKTAPVSRARNFSCHSVTQASSLRGQPASCLSIGVVDGFCRQDVCEARVRLFSCFVSQSANAATAIHHFRRIRRKRKIHTSPETRGASSAMRCSVYPDARTRRHADRRKHSRAFAICSA